MRRKDRDSSTHLTAPKVLPLGRKKRRYPGLTLSPQLETSANSVEPLGPKGKPQPSGRGVERLTSKVPNLKQPRKPLEEELVQRTRDLEILYDMSNLINQSLDLDTVLRTALEMASSVTGFEMGAIHLLNEEGDALEMKSHIRHPAALFEEVKVLKYGEGISGRSVQLNQPVISSIADYPSARIAPVLKEAGVQTVLAFPLRAKGKVVGAISLLSHASRELNPREIDLLESIGNEIGIALENAQLFSRVAKGKSEWETTFDAVTDLIIIHDKDYRILRANKAVFKRLGLKSTEIIKKKCHEIFYSREIPCEGCYLTEALRTKKPILGERDSEYLRGVFQHYAFPVNNEAGEVVAVIDLAREITEEKRLETEKEVVNSINRILTSSLDLRENLKDIHSELKRVLDSERMSIALFDEAREGFRFFSMEKDYDAGQLVGNVFYSRKGTHFERVTETGLPVIIDTTKCDSWIGQKLLEEEEIRSSLVFPLEYKGKIIGAMNFGSRKTNHFSQAQFNLLRQIAPGLAIAIQNALLFGEMKGSEGKYRTIIETMQDGYFEADLAGHFTFVNDAECRSLGYPKNELIGMNNRQYADEENAQKLYQAFNRLYRTGEPIKLLEMERIRKDGTKAVAEISASLIRDLEGKRIGFRGISRDVTERKRMEEALKENEKEAKRLAQENELVAEIGRIISTTLNIEEVYEGFAEEVHKLIPFDLISINTIDREGDNLIANYLTGAKDSNLHIGERVPISNTMSEYVLKTQSSLLIQMKNKEAMLRQFPHLLKTFQAGFRSIIVVPLIAKDEVIGTLHLRSMKGDYTETDLKLAERVVNQIAGAIANAQLFVERKRAEEALRKSEERFRELYDSAPVGYHELDTDGRITQVNRTEQEMLGYTVQEMLGQHVWKFIAEEESHQAVLAKLAGAVSASKAFERTYRRKDGTTLPVIIEDRLLRDSEGRITGIRSTIQDITHYKRAEDALRESEDLYRDLVEYSQYLIYTHDLKGRILSVNQEGARLLGYEQRDLLNKNIRDLLVLEVRDGFDTYLDAIRKDGAAKGLMLVQTATGEKRIWEYNNNLRTEGVTAPIVRAIAHDITEHLRAEKAVTRLSQENAIMAEIGRIISSTLNIEEVYERFAEEVRKVVAFDRVSVNIINPDRTSVIIAYAFGTKVRDIQEGSLIPLDDQLNEDVVSGRQCILIQLEGESELIKKGYRNLVKHFQAGIRSAMIVPLISKDQVIGIFHLQSLKPNAYAELDLRLAERVGNQIAGAIANAQLFTERKQAEEALKRNQEELIKKNEEIEASRRTLQLALEELEAAYKELKATQAKILQQEKMASIGQLAAGVAHEINNPMAFISSNLGTLNKYVNRLTEFIQTQSEVIESLNATDAIEELNRKQKELKLDYIIEDIKGVITESLDGSERVQKIVQGLRSFARVDEAEYKYANINECIESTLNIVWNELKYKATLKKDYGNIPLTKCYPQQMNQVFMNLLINAGHAIEKQGEIMVKTRDEDGSILIAISDTGHGIAKEDLNKIFEPFFTTKEVGKGTGLGLSITYEIVQKHDGEITVESEVGKGTTFTVRLPIV
jgi:PAS domain S-box-containing protein